MAEIVKEHNINKKSKAPFIIVTVIFLIILIAVGIIIRFNIGNVTEKYLRNTLEKVPIVNNLLPPKNEEGDKYANISKEQLVKESKELQKKIEDKEQFINIYKDNIEKLEAEITRLKEIENQQIQYKEDERKFSEMVALEDPKGFIEFFKNTHPDTAAEIYERLIGEEIEIQKPGVRKVTFNLRNNNKLLGSYSGTTGLITGFTSIAGYCIVGTADQSGFQLIAVVLGALNNEARYGEAAAMFDYGFESYNTLDYNHVQN